jgi:hypothetical protein
LQFNHELTRSAFLARGPNTPRADHVVKGILIEKVARYVDDSKTSAFFCMCLKISLYKNLDSLVVGMHFHAHR